jgi:hypothetical protein
LAWWSSRCWKIVIRLLELVVQPQRAAAVRRTGQQQPAPLTWKRVTEILLDKVSFAAQATGV